jgi:hypothetical protein
MMRMVWMPSVRISGAQIAVAEDMILQPLLGVGRVRQERVVGRRGAALMQLDLVAHGCVEALAELVSREVCLLEQGGARALHRLQ